MPKGGSTLGESKKWERNCGEGERKATKGWEGEGERKATKGWEGVRTENLLTQKKWERKCGEGEIEGVGGGQNCWRNTTHTSKHTPNITQHLPKGGSTLGESKKWERKCGEGEHVKLRRGGRGSELKIC